MWRISDKPPEFGNLNLSFSIDPPDYPLSAFIMGVPVSQYPILVRRIALSEAFTTRLSSYQAYDAMDSQDLENAEGIQPDEVEVYHEVFGASFVKEFLFDEIIYDYSLTLLKVYKEHNEVQQGYSRWLSQQTQKDYLDRKYYLDYNPNWGIAMEEELPKLKQKNEDRWKK